MLVEKLEHCTNEVTKNMNRCEQMQVASYFVQFKLSSYTVYVVALNSG